MYMYMYMYVKKKMIHLGVCFFFKDCFCNWWYNTNDRKNIAFSFVPMSLAQEEEEEEDEAGPSSIADQSLGEEELVMTQTEVGTKCPFTQQEMTNPVRNTICEHHYEKRGIDELLSKRKRFR